MTCVTVLEISISITDQCSSRLKDVCKKFAKGMPWNPSGEHTAYSPKKGCIVFGAEIMVSVYDLYLFVCKCVCVYNLTFCSFKSLLARCRKIPLATYTYTLTFLATTDWRPALY